MTEPPGSSHERGALASELDLVVADVEAEGAAPTAFLVGLSGRYAGKLFRLRPGENVIGRTSIALVRLDEKAVSHQHAKLLLNSRGCFVVDLESTNGTFVNDARVAEAVELHAGDVLRCGTSNFGFLTDAEDDEQHTRAMARLAPNTGKTTGRSSLLVQRATTHHPPAVVHASMEPAGEAPGPTMLETLDGLLDKIGLAWRFVVDNKWIILGSVVLMAGVGAASVEVKVPLATATCEILLRVEDPRRRKTSERLVDYFEVADKGFVNPELVRRTMREMGMGASPGAVRGTTYSLEFKTLAIGNYLLSYHNKSADVAERFLAAHVKNFLEYEIGKAISVVKSEADLLRKQYEENEDQLRALEAKMRDFKERHLNSLPETAMGQIASRAALVTQRDLLAAQLDRARQELALARKQLGSGVATATVQQNRTLPYQQSLLQVRQDLVNARAQGFADSHPDVVKLKAKEAEAERLLAEAKAQEVTDRDRLVDATHQQMANRVAELEVVVNSTGNELGMVEGRLAETSKIAASMPKVEAEYADLLRRMDAAKALHGSLHERLKAKELQLDFERASVAARYEVMRQPHAFPVSKTGAALKRAGMGAGAGVALGIGASAAFWLFRYSRRRRISLDPGTALVRRSSGR